MSNTIKSAEWIVLDYLDMGGTREPKAVIRLMELYHKQFAPAQKEEPKEGAAETFSREFVIGFGNYVEERYHDNETTTDLLNEFLSKK